MLENHVLSVKMLENANASADFQADHIIISTQKTPLMLQHNILFT